MWWWLIQFAILLAIAWFDFKDRLIPLLLFIAAFCLAGVHLYQNLWQCPMVLLNVGVGLIQIFLVAFWLKIRNRNLDFFNDAFGWGDVFMLLIVAFYFVPMQYLVFIIISCVLSIAFALIVGWRFRKRTLSIPLAGIMAVLLLLYQSYLYLTDSLSI